MQGIANDHYLPNPFGSKLLVWSNYMRVILHMCNKYTTKPLSFCIRLELGHPGLEASADARARATRINITHLEEDGGGRRPYSLYRSYTDLCMVYLSGVHRYIYVACAIHILMCYIQLAIQQCILVYYIPSAYVVCYVWAPKQTFVVSFLSRPHAQFLIIMRPHERHQQWHITCSQRTPLRTPFSQDSQRVIGLAWAPHTGSSCVTRAYTYDMSWTFYLCGGIDF